ncbi:MAG: glycosyltransferase family 4 protein, partial [bacterium]
MKVAILMLNAGRGSGEAARQHVRYLIKQGHKVFLLYPGNVNDVPEAVNINIPLDTDIMPVHEYLPSAANKQKQVARMTYEEAVAYLPGYTLALERIAADIDIIIGHHANLTAIATHETAMKYKLPYVLFLHGTGIEPRHMELWDNRLWQRISSAIEHADGLLVTTAYVKDELVRPLIRVPDSRYLILPCGIDLEEMQPGNVQGIRDKYQLPDRFVISPGALTYMKGPQNVVEASKEYADLAKTILIGEGGLKDKLKKDLGERGFLLGFVSREDKARLISAADILVAAPEKKEHFGIIYAEALAAGTPVVAYSGGGVGSIVTPDAGILTERSPRELGRNIRRLLMQPELAERFSLNGRKRAEENFNNERLVARLAGWLEVLISKK